MPATLNGKDVLSCVLVEPRVGIWTATVDVDSEAAIAGKVTLVIDGVTWVGTVSKGDLHAGRVHVQIVGGTGKLAKVLDVKHYRGATFGSVVADLMRETGETLSATTDARVRGHSISRWTRPLGKASVALKQVADELKLVWRILRDGTVWLGEDNWAEAKAAHDEIDRTPGRDALFIAPEAPHVQPGSTFEGKRVSRVTTSIQEGQGLRQEILFESADGGNRVAEDIAAVINQHIGSKIDYSRLYPSRVVRQASDGSLELLPDAQNLRGNGLTGVPLRFGVPGLSAKIPPGGKVLLYFEAGDPKLPACCVHPENSSVIEMTLTLTSELTINAPSLTINGSLTVQGDISALGEVQAHYPIAPVRLTTHLTPTPVGNSGPPLPGT